VSVATLCKVLTSRRCYLTVTPESRYGDTTGARSQRTALITKQEIPVVGTSNGDQGGEMVEASVLSGTEHSWLVHAGYLTEGGLLQ
jgi:hypothetical protein